MSVRMERGRKFFHHGESFCASLACLRQNESLDSGINEESRLAVKALKFRFDRRKFSAQLGAE